MKYQGMTDDDILECRLHYCAYINGDRIMHVDEYETVLLCLITWRPENIKRQKNDSKRLCMFCIKSSLNCSRRLHMYHCI